MKIADLIRECGIILCVSNDELKKAVGDSKSPGFCIFDPELKRFKIVISEDLDDDVAEIVLVHELAHIIRGDLTLKGDRYLVNVATDAVINQQIGLDKIALVNNRLGIESITIDSLIENGSVDPSRLPEKPGWKTIYELLVQHQNQMTGFGVGLGDFQQTQASSVEEAEKERARVSARISCKIDSADSEDSDELKEKIKETIRGETTINVDTSMFNGVSISEGYYRDVELSKERNKKMESLIRRVLNTVGTTSRSRSFRSTYFREGRVPYMMGRIIERRPLVSVLLDLSGSMDGVVKVASGFAASIARYCDVEFIAFADSAEKIGKEKFGRTASLNIGCGTQLTPAIKLVSRNCDCAVLISDMEIPDWEAIKFFPKRIIFVCMGNNKPPKRNGDIVINWEDKSDC